MAKPPLKKMAPKRTCKFNDDWRRNFAWIAKLPDCRDNGMAQCNLCVTDFSISSGGSTDVRRHQESARPKGVMVQYVAHGQNILSRRCD